MLEIAQFLSGQILRKIFRIDAAHVAHIASHIKLMSSHKKKTESIGLSTPYNIWRLWAQVYN
jgi:hypothetical protein